ncbi:MAG TPA: hypothetical protein VGQ42_17980 [Candidatus Dormibacteraeota bacterium]|nr:hypothetical protein [Candidatus Dormibacteraeota bacterium]
MSVPVKLHPGLADGTLVTNDGVATFDVHNTTAEPVAVVRIDGVDGDAGLGVTYVGFTHCLPSCDKTGDWDDPQTQRILGLGVEGRFPLVVPPDDPSRRPVQMVLRLSVKQEGMASFRAGCLWLRSLKLTLSDGRKVDLRAYDGLSVLGVFAETSALPAATPPGPARCPLAARMP